MTIPEQAGKAVNTVVDSLKTNPSCLAALAVVALFAVLQYFERENQSERMIARTEAVEQLLSRCYLDGTPVRSIQKEPPGDQSRR